jgi:hypothetical protein
VSGVPPSAARVEDASSVLVLRPRSATVDDAGVKRALIDDPEAAGLVGISLSEQPAVWYDKWRGTLGCDPDTAAVVTTPELAGDDDEDYVTVKTVTTPSNLTRIGVKTTPFLTRWDNPIVIVESLSVLCQYADSQEVYKFLHVLTTQLRSSGGEAQVYLDPVVEDDRTVERLKGLFDSVIEYDPDEDSEDDWTVRRRRS